MVVFTISTLTTVSSPDEAINHCALAQEQTL